MAQLSEEAREAGQKANFVALTAMPLSSMLSNLDVALVALAGGYLSLRGTIDVGTVASFFIFARTFSRPLNQFAQILNMALQARAGATRVFEILDEQAEIVDRPGAEPVTHLDGSVETEIAAAGEAEDYERRAALSRERATLVERIARAGLIPGNARPGRRRRSRSSR